jgi:hypothetical protein
MAVVQRTPYQEFVEFVVSRPTLEQITEFRLSDESEARISLLLEYNRTRKLTEDEEAEMEDFSRLEHIVRMMKIRAWEILDKA